MSLKLVRNWLGNPRNSFTLINEFNVNLTTYITGIIHKSGNVDPLLVQCWASVADKTSTYIDHAASLRIWLLQIKDSPADDNYSGHPFLDYTPRAGQGAYSPTSYDMSWASDWSRWPIWSPRYIVTCTRIFAPVGFGCGPHDVLGTPSLSLLYKIILYQGSYNTCI